MAQTGVGECVLRSVLLRYEGEHKKAPCITILLVHGCKGSLLALIRSQGEW